MPPPRSRSIPIWPGQGRLRAEPRHAPPRPARLTPGRRLPEVTASAPGGRPIDRACAPGAARGIDRSGSMAARCVSTGYGRSRRRPGL